MRIIGGTYRGRRLESPRSLSIRPATDRVRESIFNLIAARRSFEDVSVLDVFCGTGALGLEAISRGAARVTFVDIDRNVLRLTRRNAELLDVVNRCDFLVRDAVRFLSKHDAKYDLVFADPPYHLNAIPEIPRLVRNLLQPSGLFFYEHDRHYSFDETDGCIESRKYGRTIVSIFGPEEPDP